MTPSVAPSREPPQPGLRSFIVYKEIPLNFFAFQVCSTSAEPHLCDGEWAVIDGEDRQPMSGELFLIQWNSGRQELVELKLRAGRYGTGPNGEIEDGYLWYACVRQRMLSLHNGEPYGPRFWADGPYRLEHIQEKLVGKVVGIYDPFSAHAVGRRAA